MRLGNLLVLVLVACVKKPVTTQEALTAALAAVDRAWERREPGFERVQAALATAEAVNAKAPGLLWRQARLELARGLSSPDPRTRIEFFGRARDRGWTCAFGGAAAQGVLREFGLEAAIEKLEPERQTCASWATLGWARWMLDFGPEAAALDAPRLRMLSGAGKHFALTADRQRMSWADALRGDGAWPSDAVASIDRYRTRPTPTSEDRRALDSLDLRSPEARAYRDWVIR